MVWPVGASGMPSSTALRDAWYSALVAAGFERLIVLSDLDRRFAVLLSVLSDCERLALHWVRLRQRQLDRWKSGWAEDVTAATLGLWRSELSGDPLLQRALREPSCCLRAEAHIFLTESVVAEHVVSINASGLPVPSSYVVQLFVRLLSAVPQASPVTELRERLGTNPNASKKWMHRFRERWSLHWGDRCVPHGIGVAVQDRRASLFFQWFRWAAMNAGSPDVIVVNMDETMLSNVQPLAKGNVICSPTSADVADAIVRRQAPLPRTSLIASICSDEALQKVLPQVRLPRTANDQMPSRAVLTAYARAGPPQVARHGGTGWAAAPVLCWWLRALRGAILKERPGARIVLVWDCAPSHICVDVLSEAKRLAIRIVCIPCKMTWRLQPLDTHVFSRLKHSMRTLEFSARVRALGGTVPPLERIELQGDAIKTTLVDTSWARTMQRSGLSAHPGIVRDGLRQLYERSTSRPALPHAEDLLDLLMVPASRVPQLADLMFWAAAPAVQPGRVQAAASTEPAVLQATETSGATSRPAWSLLRLPSSARLGSTAPQPPLAENFWAPRVLPGRVETRSMTSSRAAGVSQSPAAASEPPAKRRRGG